MSKSHQLSAAVKKEITNDWAGSFPSLAVYKSMWLLKRHGPLLMGVILDRTRSNDAYLPSFHVHNLLVPSSVITLSLIYPVPDARRPQLAAQIKVAKHKEEFSAAVAFLKEALPCLEAPILNWKELVHLNCDFIRQRRDYAIAKYCAGVFRDVILLAHWCGHGDYANHCEAESVRIMKSWGSEVDVKAWQESILRLIDPDTMQRTLDSELVKHKLSNLPVCELGREGEAESITGIYTASWA